MASTSRQSRFDRFQFLRRNPLRQPLALLILVALLLPIWLFASYLPRLAPWLALGGLFLLYLGRSLAIGRWRAHTPVDGALLLILLTLPVGLWASADHAASLPRAWAFIANLAIFWAMTAQTQARSLRLAAWLLPAAGLGLATAFALGTNFGGNKLPFIQSDIYSLLPGGWRPFWNPAGFNPNLSGGLLALFWAPAVMLALAPTPTKLRILSILTAAVLSILLLLAQSRGALIGAAVALPIMTIRSHRRWLLIWPLLLGAAVVILLRSGVALTPDTLLGQSAELGVSSLQGRIEIWSRAIYILQDFAFTGVGLGMVQTVIHLLYPLFTIAPDAQFLHAHNIFLQTGAEMGFPGLIAHLTLYLTLFVMLWRASRPQPGHPPSTLALGLLGALTIFLVHGCFEVITYATRAAVVVWALFGLMIAVANTDAAPD